MSANTPNGSAATVRPAGQEDTRGGQSIWIFVPSGRIALISWAWITSTGYMSRPRRTIHISDKE